MSSDKLSTSDDLKQTISDMESPVRPSNEPPPVPGSVTIDAGKLLDAWERNIDTMKGVIRAIEKNEQANRRVFRALVATAALVLVASGVNVWVAWHEMRGNDEVLATARAAGFKLDAVSRAIAAQADADAAEQAAANQLYVTEPEVEQAQAVQQVAAIRATIVMAPKGEAREHARRRLKVAAKKARAVGAKVDSGDPLAGLDGL